MTTKKLTEKKLIIKVEKVLDNFAFNENIINIASGYYYKLLTTYAKKIIRLVEKSLKEREEKE